MQLNREVIQNLGISEELKSTLMKACEILVQNDENIIGIVLIGSATQSKDFKVGQSDLDLCIYSDEIFEHKDSLPIIEKRIGPFEDILMNPRYLFDYAGERIESFASYNNVMIDLTWLPTTLPYIGKSFYDVPQDFLEIHIANIFQYGKLIFGDIPNQEHINQKFFPYYDENLRQARSKILEEMISSKIDNLQRRILNKDLEIFHNIESLRRLFFQWLFLREKQYPISYDKHLLNQLNKLNLSKKEQEDILCLTGSNIFNIADNFLNTINLLLKKKS